MTESAAVAVAWSRTPFVSRIMRVDLPILFRVFWWQYTAAGDAVIVARMSVVKTRKKKG